MLNENINKAIRLKRIFTNRYRPEYVTGLGIENNIYNKRFLQINYETDIFIHNAIKHKLKKKNTTFSQKFIEEIIGINFKLNLLYNCKFVIVEGISYNFNNSLYEQSYRKKESKLLNYLGFGFEKNISNKLLLNFRIHHRSGIYGFFDGVHGEVMDI